MKNIKRPMLIFTSIPLLSLILLFNCSSNSKQQTKLISSAESATWGKQEQTSTYEFRSDPNQLFQLRHYKDQNRKDSLYIFQGEEMIHQFICKEVDPEFGPFADSVLLKVSKKNNQIEINRVNLLMVDSILYIPLTMSFNGGFYLMLYDLPSRQEITFKDDDIWAKGSVFINPSKQEILACKGQNVSKVNFELFHLKDKKLTLEKKCSIDENDSDLESFLKKVIKW